MDPAPNEPWFYSREGVQNGPVTLGELQAKARAGELNPRHDLVWQQGMPDWKPAGEVEGLFERRAPEESAGVPAQPAPAAVGGQRPAAGDPYLPPAEEEQPAYDQAQEWPGVRRLGYIFGNMILPTLAWVALIFIATVDLGVEPGIISGIVALVVTVIAIFTNIQRYPNLGMTRWWFLGQLVPFLNLWLYYRLFACPPGYAYHKKMDGVGIFLAIIYWLLVLLTITAVAIMIAVLVGAAGDPELQEALREALEAGASAPSAPAE